MTIWRQLSAH